MKKFWSSPQWAARTRRRQRRQLRLRRNRSKGVSVSERQERIRYALARRKNVWTQLAAPSDFSMIGNPDGVIDFFAVVGREMSAGKSVVLDFSGVKNLTPDAIVLLLAHIKDRKFTHGMGMAGNGPTRKDLKKIWDESGFHSQVQSALRPTTPKGAFERRRAVNVNAIAAAELVRFATSNLYGSPRPWRTVYRTLVECMTNTRAHAAGSKFSRRLWWAFVDVDDSTKRAKFAFVDLGVGIFRSPLLNRRKSALRALGLMTNVDILRSMLAGKVPSSTGRKNRGKGFPTMYKDLKDPQRDNIHNLVIIANEVYADVSKDEIRTLSSPFRGTMLCWEKW